MYQLQYKIQSIMKEKNTFWIRMMNFGACTGCHQLSERSFFYKRYQFPVCARCTGVLIGYILSIPLSFFIEFKIYVYIFICLIMFFDWLIQYLKICESTNIRRLITGILGGYGLMSIYIYIVKWVVNFI